MLVFNRIRFYDSVISKYKYLSFNSGKTITYISVDKMSTSSIHRLDFFHPLRKAGFGMNRFVCIYSQLAQNYHKTYFVKYFFFFGNLCLWHRFILLTPHLLLPDSEKEWLDPDLTTTLKK